MIKWIGQHIWDFISRFRNDVYLEDLTTTSESNVLVVDSDGKVSKNTSVGGSTTFTLTADGGSDQTISNGNTLTITGGNAISTTVSATDTVTINHEDNSSATSANNSGETWVQDLTIDTYGHVTGITSTASSNRHYKTVTHTLSSADVYGLNSGGGYVIVADGDVASGEVLVVHDILVSVTTPNWPSTGVENSASVQLQFGGTSNAGGYNKSTSFQALQSSWFRRQTNNTTKIYRPWILDNNTFGSSGGLVEDGLGLRMWTNLDPSGSAGTATESVTAVKVYCIYSILTL